MGGGHSENTMLGCALAHPKGGGDLRTGHSQNKGGSLERVHVGPHLKRHMLGATPKMSHVRAAPKASHVRAAHKTSHVGAGMIILV